MHGKAVISAESPSKAVVTVIVPLSVTLLLPSEEQLVEIELPLKTLSLQDPSDAVFAEKQDAVTSSNDKQNEIADTSRNVDGVFMI